MKIIRNVKNITENIEKRIDETIVNQIILIFTFDLKWQLSSFHEDLKGQSRRIKKNQENTNKV